jgi:hypothetical protein
MLVGISEVKQQKWSHIARLLTCAHSLDWNGSRDTRARQHASFGLESCGQSGTGLVHICPAYNNASWLRRKEVVHQYCFGLVASGFFSASVGFASAASAGLAASLSASCKHGIWAAQGRCILTKSCGRWVWKRMSLLAARRLLSQPGRVLQITIRRRMAADRRSACTVTLTD